MVCMYHHAKMSSNKWLSEISKWNVCMCTYTHTHTQKEGWERGERFHVELPRKNPTHQGHKITMSKLAETIYLGFHSFTLTVLPSQSAKASNIRSLLKYEIILSKTVLRNKIWWMSSRSSKRSARFENKNKNKNFVKWMLKFILHFVFQQQIPHS